MRLLLRYVQSGQIVFLYISECNTAEHEKRHRYLIKVSIKRGKTIRYMQNGKTIGYTHVHVS